jgi:hypothetical protein
VRGNEAMKKVYGKPGARAMRAALHGLLVLAIALPLAALPGAAARADDDMFLKRDNDYSANRYAWLFVGMTLVAYGVAANDYDASQADITLAKKAYKNYRAAVTPAAALMYRDQTTTFSHRAQAYESTANAALIVGSLFALTAIAIFRSEGPDMSPILLSERSVGFTYRF